MSNLKKSPSQNNGRLTRIEHPPPTHLKTRILQPICSFFLKEDFIRKSTKHNTKNYNNLQNIYKPTTTKISNTLHHKQDIMKRLKNIKTHCITDKTADEGSSSTYIQLLTRVNTSVSSSKLDI